MKVDPSPWTSGTRFLRRFDARAYRALMDLHGDSRFARRDEVEAAWEP